MVLGAGTLARIKNNVITYLHHDILGSAQSGTNSSGVVQWREQYSPFGEELQGISANADQAGYTGHIRDAATGLNYMQARYYDPVIGRFLSNDPVDFLGHLSRGNSAHGFNRYAYSYNNPYKFVDPDGRMPESWAELKNFGIGTLQMVGGVAEAGLGSAAMVVGTVDFVLGTRIVGATLVTGGFISLTHSKYTFDRGANRARDAWNNNSGSSTNNVPAGPLHSTAQDVGCSSDCQTVAEFADNALGVIAGQKLSGAMKGMKIMQRLKAAGDVGSMIEQTEKVDENLEENKETK